MGVALISVLAARFAGPRFSALRESTALPVVARGYRLVASLLLGGWGFEYVTAEWRVAWFAALGSAALFTGAVTGRRERSGIGAAYAGVAFLLLWTQPSAAPTWVQLLAIVAVPASLRLGTWIKGEASLLPEVRTALVLAALASVWLWVTRWTVLHVGTGQLTTAWAVLSLLVLAAGLGLRERLYRLGGFAVLALAVGRLSSWTFGASIPCRGSLASWHWHRAARAQLHLQPLFGKHAPLALMRPYRDHDISWHSTVAGVSKLDKLRRSSAATAAH
jgi:hypothetical protein